MTNESADVLAQALRALGGCPPARDLELVAAALLRGPEDLARELVEAGAGGPEGGRAWQRLAAAAEGRGSAFVLLDLVVAVAEAGAARA